MSGEVFGSAADLFAAEARARGGRELDERATKIARLRQQRGIDRLRSAFGIELDGTVAPRAAAAIARSMRFGSQTGRGKPVRLRAGCPPVRDAEHQLKHRVRKSVNEARRRNR